MDQTVLVNFDNIPHFYMNPHNICRDFNETLRIFFIRKKNYFFLANELIYRPCWVHYCSHHDSVREEAFLNLKKLIDSFSHIRIRAPRYLDHDHYKGMSRTWTDSGSSSLMGETAGAPTTGSSNSKYLG